MNIFDSTRQFVSNTFNPQHANITGQVQVLLIEARNLPSKDFFSRADPYVKMSMNGVTFRSNTIQNNANPVWNQTFSFPVSNPMIDVLRLEVDDRDTFSSDDVIGFAIVPIAGAQPGMPKDVWINLQKHPQASVHLQLTLQGNFPMQGGMGMQQPMMQGGMGMQQPYGGMPMQQPMMQQPMMQQPMMQQPMMQPPMMQGYPQQPMMQPMMQQPYGMPMQGGYPPQWGMMTEKERKKWMKHQHKHKY